MTNLVLHEFYWSNKHIYIKCDMVSIQLHSKVVDTVAKEDLTQEETYEKCKKIRNGLFSS